MDATRLLRGWACSRKHSGSRHGHVRPTALANANSCSQQIQCGSEPARDCGASVDIDAERAAVIASKLAPTGDREK
ncbi:hypothetical protein FHK92_27740 [Pseudomonas brassicacearum subsp. neoaurantiaca]|uniref:Uncharacterized protein n=1 Tax=Pseudomonas brassicacearum subsp. neoaurantiaca TaxID=494916 RepID=A0A7V8UHM7_9PSED|nr:hypothetical protein [Pseudomonas brassicacearum subsp. neoaurantiaca]